MIAAPHIVEATFTGIVIIGEAPAGPAAIHHAGGQPIKIFRVGIQAKQVVVKEPGIERTGK